MIRLFTSIYGRLAIAAVLSILILSFGDALVFDRVYFAVLLLATLVSFSINKDTFSILAIVCLFFGFEEFHWYLIENVLTDLESVWLKCYCYSICIVGCYLQRHEKLTWLVVAVISIAAVFESYWYISELPGKEIFWYVLTSGIALFVNHLLFWRPHILHRRFPDVPDWTYSKLDADFELFIKLLLVVESMMIVEYLLRYVTINSQIVYVYQGYSYLAHAINLYLLLSTFLEIKRNYFNRHLHA